MNIQKICILSLIQEKAYFNKVIQKRMIVMHDTFYIEENPAEGKESCNDAPPTHTWSSFFPNYKNSRRHRLQESKTVCGTTGLQQ